MAKENAWRQFQGEAQDYDGLIPKLIPLYHEQNEILLNLVPFETDGKLKVLDLGIGTGALSELILKSFPNAYITGFDISEKMLEVCRKKLAAFKDRLDFIPGDFLTDDFGANYDLVVSGLAVHHIDDEGKRALFKRIFKSLNKGGTLLIRDCVTGATPDLTDKYENMWRAFMRENGEDDEKWFARHQEDDTPSSLSDQLTWLREAGFINVGCHWCYLSFAIFGGSIAPLPPL